ncbi:MAG: glycosyltransferase family 4 protein [Thermoplasmatota archaeon]
MRVLYLAQHQVFSGDHAGHSHVWGLTSQLAALGHDVTLVVRPPGGPAPPPPGPGGVKLRYVEWELEYPLPFGPPERLGPQLNILEPARALRWIKRTVEESGIQIVQERHEMRLDLSPLSTRLLGVPSVLEVNSPFIEESFREGSFSFRSRNVFRRMEFDAASAIVVQTEILRRMISRHTRTPIHVIPNGADPALFTPAVDSSGLVRVLWGEEEAGPVLGFAGAFHPWHGAPDLVEAFSRLAARDPRLKLLMVGGGGEDFDRCMALVRERGLEKRARLTGRVPYADLPRYLNLCSVLVAPFAPSRDERRRAVFERYGLWWCPLKVFEYMAMAKPVVCSEVGSLPEYLKGAGLLYPEGDVGALTESIDRLLADPGLRARLGRVGRERVEREYSWSIAARRTVEVYKRLLR